MLKRNCWRSRRDEGEVHRLAAMKIYGDLVSGNCLKVKYTADFLGIPYRWEAIDIMKGESRTPEFLAINPAGQVPAIELGDGRTLIPSCADNDP